MKLVDAISALASYRSLGFNGPERVSRDKSEDKAAVAAQASLIVEHVSFANLGIDAHGWLAAAVVETAALIHQFSAHMIQNGHIGVGSLRGAHEGLWRRLIHS